MENFISEIKLKLEKIIANNNRVRRDDPLHLSLEFEEIGPEQDKKLVLALSSAGNTQRLSFPIPYRDQHENYVIGRRVKRAVGTWYHRDTEYTYWQLMTWILIGRIETAFSGIGMRSQLERLALSFDSSRAPLTFRSTQELVDRVVNRLPLAGTPYEAWAMCNRVVFLDPDFEELTPEEALEYQKALNVKHFPWTSLGLSDSAMTSNYLLKVDLRNFTPFGLKHHNPMRNLYQTLGMKGDDTPVMLTESALKLAERGVERRGWNLMTCFLDLPLNFEDQLIVDVRHLEKLTIERKRVICFGEVKVCAGDELNEGHVIALEPGGKNIHWWNKSDNAIVETIEEDRVIFNGTERAVKVVYIQTRHMFKEGIKFTNFHGNKGVVTFADCGQMYDAGRQKETPIDIIVSASTVGKRKNYGQVLEVLATLLCGIDEEIIIPDDCELSVEELAAELTKKGYAADGTSQVKTQWGDFQAICGWSFWGLIKNPESQLWSKYEVEATDNRNRRTAGNKISHIELKGLTTIFGPGNAITNEILSYQQGIEDVHEMVEVLEVMRGKSMLKPIMDWSSIKPLEQKSKYFHTREELSGTIIDETLCPDGFALKIPGVYHIFIPENEQEDIKEQLLPLDADLKSAVLPEGRNVFLNTLYVPHINIRNSWEHSTGLWGLSDIGGYLNSLITTCHRFGHSEVDLATLFMAVKRYFHHVSKRMSTKRGEVATYALAIRYPNSAKATATLAKEGLPPNHVEIHQQMADDLGIKDGDYVIAERFPCLGFKSLRIQKVRVTNDPQCRYVIRVSGNSLVSQNLDFDGDVLFLMSFHTEAARETLEKEFHNPEPLRIQYIEEANNAKLPKTMAIKLEEIGLVTFDPLTPEWQAQIVADLTGVKRGTGTAVALAYNLMRIIEGSVGYKDKETNLALEVILDTVANSVFSQKHAGESLEQRCKRAVCLADFGDMMEMGFPKRGSQKLCEIIKTEAAKVGVNDLAGHFENHLKRGRSNIINLIVRSKHKVYFATRSNLHPIRLLEHLDSPPTDLVSHLWHKVMKGKENVAEN